MKILLLLVSAIVCRAADGLYLLGPGDRVSVSLGDLKEMEIKPAVVEMDGMIQLQHAGRIKADGLSTVQLAREIEARLAKVVRKPQVTVEVTEYASQPVSVLGAVNKPGIHQLKGRRTLAEVLALAEGLRPEAGNHLVITRLKTSGAIPLHNSRTDATGEFSTAEVNLSALMEARNPATNIQMRPNDVVTIPKGDIVYVLGSVKKPGGFVLADREAMTVLRALSMAEGLLPMAAVQNARILRSRGAELKAEQVPVDVKGILASRKPDEPMRANDILYIPNSAAKSVGMRALEAGVQIATGVVIWRR
ncbi:MAG: polysaccharide biosynthesis/export family protein [Acidobacteria bacterium]|nr:polysaccharide biosynthesis/export family protein [Acidobacteriota bacterium]